MIKKLLSGGISNILNLLLQLILGLWVFRELYNYLGDYDFGLWAILFAVFAHVVLFEFGLGMVITRHSAKDNQDFDTTDALLIESCFKTYYIFSIVVLVVALAGTVFFASYFTENGLFEHGDSIVLVSMLIAGSFIANYLSGAYQAFLLGKLEHGFVNKIRLITNLSRSLLLLICIELHLSIEVLSTVYFVVSLFELFYRAKKCRELGFLFSPINCQYQLKTIFDIVKDRGRKLIFLRVNDYARNSGPIIVASSFLGATAVTPLRVSGRLMELFSEVMMSFNFVLTPYFSKIGTKGGSEGEQNLNKKVLYSIMLSSAFTSLIFANLILHGEWFLELWLGQFPPETYSILIWFAAAFSISNMQAPLNSFLVAKEHYKQVSFLATTELLISVTCLIGGVYLWGGIGAAYALLFSILIVRMIIQPYVAASVLKVKLQTYYSAMLAPVIFVFIYIYATQVLSDLISVAMLGSNLTQILIQIVILILALSIVYRMFIVKRTGSK